MIEPENKKYIMHGMVIVKVGDIPPSGIQEYLKFRVKPI